MYYEERVVEGRLYCRYAPDAKFVEVTSEVLTFRVTTLTQEVINTRLDLTIVARLLKDKMDAINWEFDSLTKSEQNIIQNKETLDIIRRL